MWSEVILGQDGEVVVLDPYDERARPGDESSHIYAVRRLVGVTFHAVGGAAQKFDRPDRVTSPCVSEAHGELRQPSP